MDVNIKTCPHGVRPKRDCKECQRVYYREWRQKNPQSARAATNKWRRLNPKHASRLNNAAKRRRRAEQDVGGGHVDGRPDGDCAVNVGDSMTVSVCITINRRSEKDLAVVFESMEKQAHDEFVVVLDRPEREIQDYCRKRLSDDSRVKFVEVDGPPGWRSPVTAWNRGFDAVTGDVVYCFSSETVQQPGNVSRAVKLLSNMDTVVHGKAECSCGPQGQEVNWGGTAPGNLLCDAAHPRPLGFIWAAPMAKVTEIGGYDTKFADGFWFDDNDFFYRLWATGLDFVFDDKVYGFHLHHDRPDLDTPRGQEGIQRNQRYMLEKHGLLDPWNTLEKATILDEGQTIWRHI